MRAYIAEFLQVQLSPYKKSNYVRPPRPKEQGMLRATRLFFEISEIFEALLPRFPWSARLKLCFRLSQNSHQCVIDLENFALQHPTACQFYDTRLVQHRRDKLEAVVHSSTPLPSTQALLRTNNASRLRCNQVRFQIFRFHFSSLTKGNYNPFHRSNST